MLHVHEFATGRWGRMQVDCNEGEGEAVVDEIVTGLKNAGITADGELREARFGHIARNILTAADEHDARMVVLGSSGRTDVPYLPVGSVSHRLLHLARATGPDRAPAVRRDRVSCSAGRRGRRRLTPATGSHRESASARCDGGAERE